MKIREMISIIVPIYKVEEYLNECIASLVNQTYKNLEIILVDDGSPDGCGRICDEWACKEKRIRVLHKENGGLSDARNAGIRVAQGEYIGFVDSDDVVHPNMYSDLLELMKRTDSDIACCAVTRDLGRCYPALDGSKSIRKEYLSDYQMFSSLEAVESLLRLETITVTVWNKLYKRKVIGDIKFPKGKYHEDEFWTYLVLEQAERIVFMDKPYYGYREREESITTQKYTSRHLDHLDGRSGRLEYLQKKYPQFYSLERTNIRFECIRAMQLCFLHMKGEELNVCMERIHKLVKRYPLKYKDYKKLPLRRQVWCFLSNLTFDGTCKIRNYFHYGP